MLFDTIITEISENIIIARINRPEVMNALSLHFIDELDTLISKIEMMKDIRVLIITGNEKSFAAGGDIHEMMAMNTSEATAASAKVQSTFNRLSEMYIPAIAAINGYAMGGGSELAMACDFCIAAHDAVFGLPESKLGILPGGNGTQLLSRIAGLNNALFLLLTGETFSANEAKNIGIVQKLVSPENVLTEAIQIAYKMINVPKETLHQIKQVTRKGLMADYSDGCKMEANAFGLLVGDIGKKGMQSFLSKKK